MKRVFILIGLVITCLLLTGCNSNSVSDRKVLSKEGLSTEKIYNIMISEGYKYANLSMSNGVESHAISGNGITIKKVNNRLGIYDKYPEGVNYYFNNKNINSNLLNIDKKKDKKQYNAYKEWLKEEGLTTEMVKELLDYAEENGWKE